MLCHNKTLMADKVSFIRSGSDDKDILSAYQFFPSAFGRVTGV